MSETQERPKRILGEAALVVLLTAGAYLLAFSYETGFAKHFGIPTDLISVDLRSLLLFGGGSITAVLGVLVAFNFLVMTFPSKAHPAIQRALVRSIIFAMPCSIPIALYGIDHPQKWWWWVLVYVAYLFFEFVYPLFVTRGTRGYVNKLAAVHAADDRTPDLATTAAARFGPSPVIVVCFFPLALLIARIGGETTAMKKTGFLVLDSKPARVVLRAYGETLVCAVADLDRHEVISDFLLVKFGENSLPLRLQEIGPLQLRRQSPIMGTPIPPTPTPTPSPPIP